ncbi:MAG: hypothetical protein K6E85_07315 [Lachnospiraceae bacterium]|nr:hypothetical protein [Lachnospiraceae bacterium]
MRTLKQLTNLFSHVWIFCENEELQVKFLKQAEGEGFLTLTGEPPTKLFHHQLYGFSNDMTMGYLAGMVWTLSKNTDFDTNVRIDYEKYVTGSFNYFCKTDSDGIDLYKITESAYSIANPKQFYESCKSFIEDQSFEDYIAFIYRGLIEIYWKHKPEEALRRIKHNFDLFKIDFKDRIPVADIITDRGYTCG